MAVCDDGVSTFGGPRSKSPACGSETEPSEGCGGGSPPQFHIFVSQDKGDHAARSARSQPRDVHCAPCNILQPGRGVMAAHFPKSPLVRRGRRRGDMEEESTGRARAHARSQAVCLASGRPTSERFDSSRPDQLRQSWLSVTAARFHYPYLSYGPLVGPIGDFDRAYKEEDGRFDSPIHDHFRIKEVLPW